MPDESRAWKVLGSVGAAALSVITAVAIYRFENPPKKDVPPPPPSLQVAVTGMVSDVSTHQPIGNALIVLSGGGDIESGYTDSEGRYLFKLTGTSDGLNAVNVDVQAKGYRRYTQDDVPVRIKDINYVGPELEPVMSAAVAGVPGGGTTGSGTPASGAPAAAAPAGGEAATGAPVATGTPGGVAGSGTNGVSPGTIPMGSAFHPILVRKVPPNFVVPGLTRFQPPPKKD